MINVIKNNSNIKFIIVAILSLLLINAGIVNSILKKYITNQYREKFVIYSEKTVDIWNKYEVDKNPIEYQCGIVYYGIAIDYYEKYYLCFSNRSNREYLALYTIYQDLLNNMQCPPSYFSQFIYYLSLFDNRYEYGSDEHFIEIYKIVSDLQF